MKSRRNFDGSVQSNTATAIVVGLLVGVASWADTPVYEFRGFDSNSTCDNVKDREIRNGGKLSSYEKRGDARLWAYYIDSSMFGFDTTIVVACGSNRDATSIHYEIAYPDGMNLDEVFERFYSAIAEEFGLARIDSDSVGRNADFLCKQGFLIQLNLIQASTVTLEGSVRYNSLSLGIFSGIGHCE